MKSILQISWVLITVLLFSCKKELLRDNPFDSQSQNAYKGKLAFSKAVIIDDIPSFGDPPDTHNGQINKYEKIKFRVYIKNTGLKTIKGAKADITLPNNSDIDNFKIDGSGGGNGNVEISFGDIEPGQEIASNELIDFSTDFIIDNEDIGFNIVIRDPNGENISDYFTFKTYHFNPSYNFIIQKAVLIKTDQPDGKIRPSSWITIGLTLKNTGTTASGDIQCDLKYNNSNIYGTAPWGGLDFGSFSAGGSSAQIELGLGIDFRVAPGTTVPVELDIYDRLGNTWKATFNFLVGS